MKYVTLAIYLIILLLDFILLHRSFIYDIIYDISYDNVHLRKRLERSKFKILFELFLAAIWPIRFLRYAFILIFK